MPAGSESRCRPRFGLDIPPPTSQPRQNASLGANSESVLFSTINALETPLVVLGNVHVYSLLP